MDEEQLPAPTLEDLRGLALPEPPAYTPDTLAWWVLLGALLLGLLVLGVLLWRRWRARRYRREGKIALRALAADLDDPARRRAAAQALPALVKRVALAAWPRDEVADLTGDDWLAFLDESYGGHEFQAGPGRLLATMAYDATAPDTAAWPPLVDLVGRWMDEHHVRA